MNTCKILSLIFLNFLIFSLPCSAMAKKTDKPTGTAMNTQEKERKNIKVTFIELGSVKCIPCKAMQPIMDEVEKEYGDQVEVIFYDVWTEKGEPYAKKYKIRAIPTQVFLDKNGEEYFRHMGFFPKKEIIKVLKEQGVD
ncbi:thioredoxin family protein [Elusimicrobiota bacterium]